ncbi:hypothetical protein OAS39_02450 [Pirellulales bacterium]|nr:hypothetical protein [Pirellulales bacterium]
MMQTPDWRMLRIAVFLASFSALSTEEIRAGGANVDPYGWNEVNAAAEWNARAGLEAVELRDAFYLMGGRTPIDPNIVPVFGASTIWGDVWKSVDRGESWSQILATETPGHWAARAYFEAVTKTGQMFVLGGQDFNVITVPGPMGPHSTDDMRELYQHLFPQDGPMLIDVLGYGEKQIA